MISNGLRFCFEMLAMATERNARLELLIIDFYQVGSHENL